ncbi:DUF881 domain-containing protein [Acidipropionibacterium jensenii]|uniref:DUF881 domain-containing protein n=1 Tax=Acidipropionibacterium jensenii TaxID=1749 RepID=UPI00214AD6CC|nr:DUF881 domain-containing protein [Acidipropionibacterium jensenii]
MSGTDHTTGAAQSSSGEQSGRRSQRADASMDLLRQVREGALEPEYLHAADRHGWQPRRDDGRPAEGARSTRPGGRGWIGTAVMLLLAGLLLGGAWRSTSVARPSELAERDDLINRIQSAQAHQSGQQAAVNRLQVQVSSMRAAQSADSSLDTRLAAAGKTAGTVAVSGPGIQVVIDDAADGSGEGRVGDQDLRQLINGLWQAGAEAISVNGHRITTRTAVRSAGSAITVDYVSLTRPYRISAIGDSAQLPGRLSQNGGGQWLTYISDNFGVRYSVTTATSMQLPAATQTAVNFATPR